MVNNFTGRDEVFLGEQQQQCDVTLHSHWMLILN